jgi:hypothetical protein
MKRLMHAFKGISLIAALLAMPAGADDATSAPATLPASVQAPATDSESLVNANRENVQMTLASVTAIDLQSRKSPIDYSDIPTSQIVPAAAPARNGGEIATEQEPVGKIWMFVGAITIAFMIAWRRCQWASLRGGSAISTGQRSPHPPQQPTPSPIGLSTSHGHLPFGG